MADNGEDQGGWDDEALMKYLEEEHLALVPLDFMYELMGLMKEHIMRVLSVSDSEVADLMERLDDLIGIDGMMDISMDEMISWMRVLHET